jgi:pyruvate,orthophosphate dikinase
MVTEFGVRKCTGEFKFSASGEDLVGGLTASASFRPFEELASFMPILNRRLRHTVTKLGRFMGTDQEIEFTVEQGILSVLQSRAAQIGRNKNHYTFKDPGKETTRGIGIRGSAIQGLAAFDEDDYNSLQTSAGDDDNIIMVLANPTAADMPLVLSCDGLLASKGGTTSHAAIAINGIENKDYCAVMSVAGLRVNARKHEAEILDEEGNVRARIQRGDVVSIHGSTGAVYVGPRELARA